MEKLLDIDRRWIWLVMFIIMLFVAIQPIGLPITVHSDTKQFYDVLNKLPEGSIVLFGPSTGSSSLAELGPMVTAFAEQAFKKKLRIAVIETSWTTGPQLTGALIQKVADKMGAKYGVDWINIGYKPGGSATMLAAEKDLMSAAKGVDINGDDLSKFPIMKDLPAIDHEHVAAVFCLDEGSPGATDFWLPYVSQRINVPLLVGTITMSVPGNKPYLQSGQFAGMLDGSHGAAEYESLLGLKGAATQSQDGQSLAALYVTILIILGNIAYLSTRNKRSA